jgi:exopolysaccharide production protein ExoQ
MLEGLTVILTIFICIFRVFSVASMRGFNCDSIPGQPGVGCSFSFPWFTLLCLLAASSAGIFIMSKRKLWKIYLQTWRQSWFVLLFLGLIMASTIWSTFPAGTFYRSLELILITFLAAFIGVRWPLREVVAIFAWGMGSLAVACLLAVFLFPQVGIMSSPPYTGSWTGILWHRNYLGTLMALGSMIFLIRLLDADLSRRARIVGGAFYLFTLVLVAGSKSATGIILAVILTGVCLIFFAWLKLRSKMKVWHYWGIALAAFFLALLAVWKMDSLLGFLGRNSSLTGRIPLWNYLFVNFISLRPWLGYGYGVFWSFEQIRLQTQSALGWMYPVLIGDNGWVDMALHLGVVGVVFFTLILMQFGYYSVKLVLRLKTMLAFFPVSLLLFIVIGNLTLSLFLELESLTWLMLISILFAIFSSQILVSRKDTT